MTLATRYYAVQRYNLYCERYVAMIQASTQQVLPRPCTITAHPVFQRCAPTYHLLRTCLEAEAQTLLRSSVSYILSRPFLLHQSDKFVEEIVEIVRPRTGLGMALKTKGGLTDQFKPLQAPVK
jgi:hypothetical protein